MTGRLLAVVLGLWSLVLGHALEIRAAEPRTPVVDGIVPGRAVVPIQVTSMVCVGDHCERLPQPLGSGVLIDEAQISHAAGGKTAWLILTAEHVIDISRDGLKQPKLEVYLSGKWRPLKPFRKSKYADLALISAECPEMQSLTCLATETAPQGAPVTVAGFVLGREYQAIEATVERATGIVHQLDGVRSIIPGQSGCGVFDRQGDLVGITSSHESLAPWKSQYVALPEIRRFVGAVWPSLLDGQTSPEEMAPRLAPEPSRGEPVLPPDPPASNPSSPPAAPSQTLPFPSLEPLDSPVQSLERPASGPAVSPEEDSRKSSEKISGTLAGTTEPPAIQATRETPSAPVPMINSPLPPPTAAIQREPPPVSGMFFSGLALAGTIAASVATGGLAWPTVIKPAIGFVSSVNQFRKWRTSVPPRSEPTSCFGPVPAPSNQPVESEARPAAAPFPRQLDEARQLLQLAKSEGRVPVLDALRGVFIGDALDRLMTSGDTVAAGIANKLRIDLDAKINAVVPPSTL